MFVPANNFITQYAGIQGYPQWSSIVLNEIFTFRTVDRIKIRSRGHSIRDRVQHVS